MHGGYDYLLSEFGVDVKAVIEPAHGVQPSAKDLKEVIDVIKRDKIDIILRKLLSKVNSSILCIKKQE